MQSRLGHTSTSKVHVRLIEKKLQFFEKTMNIFRDIFDITNFIFGDNQEIVIHKT